MQTRRILVLGNGGFGTALAVHAAGLGQHVRLWGHNREYTRQLAERRENERYLPGIPIPASMEIGSNLEALLPGCERILSVVPTQHLRAVFEELGPLLPAELPIVSCSKGMEEKTGLLPTELIAEHAAQAPLFVLTGPCHAEELARGMPATLLLAGRDGKLLSAIQEELSGPSMRIYRGDDRLGAELGAAVKNIIAIAAGIGDGLGLGDNAKSALLTRGLAEIARFGVALGAKRETFYGLAGIGDLITTSVSSHGRNRALGERLGRGESLSQILQASQKVAEGVWTCRAVLARAKQLGVPMPITEEVADVLFADKSPKLAVEELMTRLLREEG